MTSGIYIIGTDTDVGKTVVAAGLMHLLLKNGRRAAYFKPVASGQVALDGRAVPADAAFVRAVSGFDEEPTLVTPFSFAEEVAPHLAARRAGCAIDRDAIHQSFNELKTRYDLIIAEGAGGLLVPLDDAGGLQSDLIRDLGFSCLLVARAGLGTINHTLLTLGAARHAGLKVRGIVVCGAGDSLVELDNIAMIRKLSGVSAVFVVPQLDGVDARLLRAGNLRKVFEDTIPVEDVIALMDAI